MTPDAYRTKWGLPLDYPMVALDYAAYRSVLAKEISLGRKAATAEPAIKVISVRRARDSKGRNEHSPLQERSPYRAKRVLHLTEQTSMRSWAVAAFAVSVVTAVTMGGVHATPPMHLDLTSTTDIDRLNVGANSTTPSPSPDPLGDGPVPNLSSASNGSVPYVGTAALSAEAGSPNTAGAFETPPTITLPPIRPIRFTRGTSSAGVSSAVVRGERDLYSFRARAGQVLTLHISALENNAAFDVYLPGAQPKVVDYGIDIEGTALPGSDVGADLRSWSGRVPVSGDYLVVVGGTRGNATYRLVVTLR